MFPRLKLSIAEIDQLLARATVADVRQALQKNRRDFFDLLMLISPAASAISAEIAAAAAIERQRYFGKTASLYAPLYISNDCVNSCRYCDFNRHNRQPRKVLSLVEIEQEAAAIKNLGIDSLLIVAGENPQKVNANFLSAVGEILRPHFSYLAVEIAPQTENDYRKIFAAGFEGLTLFQETYNREIYAVMHPAGPKHDYNFRLESQWRAGRAGMRTLGLAFLLGLDNWRYEAASLAAHAFYLQRECWQSKLQFAFPRLTKISGGFMPSFPVNDAELELLMSAFRLVFPESGMTVSTREPAALRDKLITICADNMSAGSKVTPGGYAVNAEKEIGQFTTSDDREVEKIVRSIQLAGLTPVRKNWDNELRVISAS